MADNTTLSAAVGTGDKIVDRDITHSGEAAKIAGAFLVGISGTAGSYTWGAINGDATNGLDVDVTRVCGQSLTFGAGAVAAGTPRVTHASDDPTVVSLASLDGKTPALGQALAAASVPVVLTAAQLTTLTPPAAITGYATETTLSTLNGKVPALGQALAAGSVPVVLPAAQITTLTPPAAITGFATETSLATLAGVVTSSRAAVNPISGQAGVAANSGTVGATTQRMTLATNDPGVVSLSSIANALFPGTVLASISVADAATSSATNGLGQTVITGTPTASSSSTYTLAGAPTVILQIAGNINMTLAFERSIDGVTFTPLAMEEIGLSGTVASSLTINESSTTFLRAGVAGFSSVRVRCTARTTGTASIAWQAGGGDAHTSANLAQVGGAAVAKGHGTASTALRVELPTDGTGTVGLNAGSALIGKVSLKDISDGDYETVAASATDQALGATGGAGDYLAGLLIVPATTSPGAVSIKDGSGSAITVFTGGASSVSNLVPFFVPLGIISGSGAWKVSTGSNVSAIGVGNFS